MKKSIFHPDQLSLKFEFQSSLPKKFFKDLKTSKYLEISEFCGKEPLMKKLEFLENYSLKVVVLENTHENHRTQGYNFYGIQPFLNGQYEEELFNLIFQLFRRLTTRHHDARYYAINFFTECRRLRNKSKLKILSSK